MLADRQGEEPYPSTMTSPPGLHGAFEFLEHHLVFKYNTGSPEGSHAT